MNIVFIILVTVFHKYCEADDEISFLTKLSEITVSEDGKSNFTQLAKKYGVAAELHDVVTEDGYILTLFHIPGAKSPVLLSHGLSTNGNAWILRGYGSWSVALAEEGYDVWMINHRGTPASRRHRHLNPDTDKQFWDFSFHDMAYDLAASIDYVCNQTGETQVFTVGHSQGGSVHFSLLSLKPEYNEKIKLFIGLAPGAFYANMPPWVKLATDAGPILTGLLETLGIEELFKDNGALSDIIKTVCSKGLISYGLCAKAVIFPTMGLDVEELEPEFLSTFVGQFPCSISRKSVAHYDQLYIKQKFCQFDYGPMENSIRYGCTIPPDYDLSKVTVNFALFAGSKDKVVTVENSKLLQKKLPNVVNFEVLSVAHLDFLFGKNAKQYLFPRVFKLFEKYT